MATTLVVSNDFPPRIGGIESFVSDVCRLLDDDVVVYTSGVDRGSDVNRRFPVVRGGPLLLPTPATSRRAVALLREHGCSRVVFGAAAPLGLLAPALRRAGATSIIGLTHGHEIWWATLPGARRLLRRIGTDCDHLTTISEFTSQRIAPALCPAARDRLLRLAPPVDTERFRPAPGGSVARGHARCVAVGRFVSQKGFATLLRAWRLVVDQLDQPELVLVGDGPQRQRLQQLIEQLGLAGTVTMTGALGRDQVIAELQRADVFALPVRTRLRGLNPEGLGLAALEAAACGLPVVIGRSGGAPETVQDGVTGFVVDPDDHRELAARISGLLADPARARAMGGRGRAYVVRHFGDAQARQMLLRALRLD